MQGKFHFLCRRSKVIGTLPCLYKSAQYNYVCYCFRLLWKKCHKIFYTVENCRVFFSKLNLPNANIHDHIRCITNYLLRSQALSRSAIITPMGLISTQTLLRLRYCLGYKSVFLPGIKYPKLLSLICKRPKQVVSSYYIRHNVTLNNAAVFPR